MGASTRQSKQQQNISKTLMMLNALGAFDEFGEEGGSVARNEGQKPPLTKKGVSGLQPAEKKKVLLKREFLAFNSH